MIVTFEKEYLRDLYETGKTNDKQHRYQPGIVRKYKFCINSLKFASCIAAIKKIKSFNYEELKGTKRVFHPFVSICNTGLNLQYMTTALSRLPLFAI